MQSMPMSPEAKSSIKVVFLVLFLDLIGFSIIFPIFPALAEYYFEVDASNFFLNLIFNGIRSLIHYSGAQVIAPIVLFGGVLGALYSLLQFVAAPIWGAISDKYGRKPSLQIAVSGLAISYLLWFFSGSFTLLIIARAIGGIMGGNISIATAVIADVTDETNRSKGMAFVGIAFALGFILGPAFGGLLSMHDLSAALPYLAKFGVNPFSMPAAFSFILSCLSLLVLSKSFKETLPEEKRGKGELHRSSNPLTLFKPLPNSNINMTNLSYFLFISAFSGMEFTLTFLAVERLNFTPLQNGYMFIFIGLILALIQGGVVRRHASKFGEKRMALVGMFLVIPGLLILSKASTLIFLYLGLFFLSIGSALIIPCLTALVSIKSPPEIQGRVLGVFRSLGALGRVIGPIFAAILYWRLGSYAPYMYGAGFLALPILFLILVDGSKSNVEA